MEPEIPSKSVLNSVRLLFLLLTLMVLQAGIASPESGADDLTFEKHVRPIFKAMCFQCHGEEEKKKAELDVRLVRLMRSGGKSGPVIVPGDPDSSLLWQLVESDEMPDASKKLSNEQKKIIHQWILQGAHASGPEPENVEEARFSIVELEHWAFQPVKRPQVPHPDGYELATPIDGFIAARLNEHDLPFSPLADRRTLIRRASIDLTGLLPTPEEVEAYVSDTSPQAWSSLIDRLLASPEFGVRWGRHWLDAAGFAESDGGASGDPKRPHAWRYRDYVINSFNRNKPVDIFIREQLAGDEMIESEIDAYNPRHRELLTATGFMRMAPDPTQSSNSLADRNMATAEAIQVIGSSLMGLTVGCAQCHDHKYDPIGTDDYYRFRAIFDPVFPLQDWQQPNARLVDVTTEEVIGEAERIEAQAKVMDEELNAKKKELAEKIQQLKLSDVPEEVRDETRQAVLAPDKDRTDRQKELLDLYPMVKPVGFISGFLVEYDNKAYREFEKEREKITELRATKPAKHMIMATVERPNVVPKSAIFFRGNPQSPGESVVPAELAVLARGKKDIHLPANDERRETTGRRTAYARHLTDGRHPLTARVFVNRIWQHHFGRGIVATPGDFGIAGETPSHPELLEWLADDFIRNGWDQKRLHRMIMRTTAYRQRAQRTSRLDEIDPENALLGRASLRRLEAEAIRDAILSVTGNLNPEAGGPSVPVTVNGEGKAVIGIQRIRDGLAVGVKGQNAAAFRRSVFIEVRRSLPLNMLGTFDQPVMKPNCDLRRSTTVATQALWFLNDEQIVQLTEDLAGNLFDEFIDAPSDQISQLFALFFAAVPTSDEMRSCMDFFNQQTEFFRNDPDKEWQSKMKESPKAAEQRALASLSQVLLASNRFLYVD